MSFFSLLGRFTPIFVASYLVVTVLMIFIIAFLKLPQVIESYIPYLLVWVMSFYVLNQYYAKTKRLLSKKQRWKIIMALTITAILIGMAFSAPFNSENLPRDLMNLFMGVLIALPAYIVLSWSAEYRATKRLKQDYPELKTEE